MADDPADPGAVSPPTGGLDSTVQLLARLRAGDESARERLVARYLPTLRRWAHGRLPAWARDLRETDDLVQETLIRSLNKMEGFQPQRPGSFLAYLRRSIVNQIRDEIRRTRRRPTHEALDEDHPDDSPSPVECVIGTEKLAAYERALASLPEGQQEAVIMSVELGFTNQQIAEALGSPSTNAARMFVRRAIERLAEVMDA